MSDHIEEAIEEMHGMRPDRPSLSEADRLKALLSDRTNGVLGEVLAERQRQEQLRKAGKFLWTCADPTKPDSEKLAVLAEEFGEAAREVTEAIIARDKLAVTAPDLMTKDFLIDHLAQSHRNLRKELIQVAAVAVAWAESLANG